MQNPRISPTLYANLYASSDFSVFQSATGQGLMAIKCVKALVTKGTAEGLDGLTDDGIYIWVPFEKVDRSNAKDYM